MKAFDIWLGNALAALLERVAVACETGSRNLKRCPDCGQNVWYGLPCVQQGKNYRLKSEAAVDRTQWPL